MLARACRLYHYFVVALALKTLGEFVITCDERRLPPPPTKKARALIAYLALHGSADVTREQLLELFWRDFDPQRARDNLNATLWSVRRMFRSASLNPDDFVRADRTVIRWRAAVQVDVERLRVLAERSDREAAEEALSLYCGDFLEGDFDDWPAAERERISLAYETMLSRATKSFGNTAAAEQLIGRNPYDEAAYATLIGSHLEAGQALAAAILVERCRRALEEVGATPSEEFEKRFGTLQRPRDDPHSDLKIPFVARDDELRFLAERFASCAAGTGSITLVHGDAGIGKSTLLANIARIAPERMRIVEVRCGGDDRESLRNAWDAVAASAAPVTVVVDDAQHLEADALSFFSAFVNATAGSTCFVVATRPEARATLRSRLEPSAPFDVALGPLSRADVEGALRQAAGSDLSGVSAKLFERTGGHPLYVARLLEALVEGGALERRSRAWFVTEKFDESLPLPGSVRTFIEARLLTRGNTPATVAGALALEPTATASDLGSVLTLDEEPLLDALDDLLSLGLIRQPQVGPQFEFSHDLVREVAKDHLNAGRAVRIHRRFADSLRRNARRDAPARIASHLLAAGEIVEGARTLLRVATDAMEGFALHDCIAACDSALTALEQLERSSERDGLLAALRVTRSRARFLLGESGAALEDADLAVGLARAGESSDALARALIGHAECREWAYEWDLAVNDLEEAAEIARAGGGGSMLAAALVGLSAAARLRGEKALALARARDACDLAVAAGDWPLAQSAVGESLLACCAWWDIENVSRFAAMSLELAQRCGERARNNHYNSTALLSYVRERREEVKRDLEAAVQGDGRTSPPEKFQRDPSRADRARRATLERRARHRGFAGCRVSRFTREKRNASGPAHRSVAIARRARRRGGRRGCSRIGRRRANRLPLERTPGGHSRARRGSTRKR